ncbi:hypothetical protein Tco_0015612 [Tanacetum coccineum]
MVRITSHLWQAFSEDIGYKLCMSTASTLRPTVSSESYYSKRLEEMPSSPVIWTEVGESQLIGPEIVQETIEKIVQIRERLKTARISARKAMLRRGRKPLEFQVGDREREVKN